jgi:hypothetical protein
MTTPPAAKAGGVEGKAPSEGGAYRERAVVRRAVVRRAAGRRAVVLRAVPVRRVPLDLRAVVARRAVPLRRAVPVDLRAVVLRAGDRRAVVLRAVVVLRRVVDALRAPVARRVVERPAPATAFSASESLFRAVFKPLWSPLRQFVGSFLICFSMLSRTVP